MTHPVPFAPWDPGALRAAGILARVDVSPWYLLVGFALIGVGVSVAWAAGALRARSVIGPSPRAAGRVGAVMPPAMGLWMVAMFGLCAWMLAPSIVYALLAGSQAPGRANDGLQRAATTSAATSSPSESPEAPASSPTSESKQHAELTPRQRVVLGAASQGLACVSVLAACAWLFPAGIRSIGLPGTTNSAGSKPFRAVLWGAPLALLLTFGASLVFQWLWLSFGLPAPSDHELIRILHEDPDKLLRVMIIISAAGIAPVFEEVFFRGCVQGAIVETLSASTALRRNDTTEPAWPRWAGILITSALFAAVHENGAGSRWMLAPLFVLAVCLGYLYERAGDLRVPIAVHALFNAVSLSLAFW